MLGWLFLRGWYRTGVVPAIRAASMRQRHPGRIGSHPRIINLSIHLQLQQTGYENGGPPGRYRPARCGNPNQAGYHNQENTRSRVAPSTSRRVRSFADNPEATPSHSLESRAPIGQSQCGGITTASENHTSLKQRQQQRTAAAAAATAVTRCKVLGLEYILGTAKTVTHKRPAHPRQQSS